MLRSSATAVARQQFALKFILALSFPCWICYWFFVLKSITGSEYLPVILINSFKHIQHLQHPIRIGNQKRVISVRIVPCFGYHLNKTLYKLNAVGTRHHFSKEHLILRRFKRSRVWQIMFSHWENNKLPSWHASQHTFAITFRTG